MDLAALESLVGRRVAIRGTGDGVPGGSMPAVVVGRSEDELRIACRITTLRSLDGAIVEVEAGFQGQLLRFHARLVVLIADRIPLIGTLIPLAEPTTVQRREHYRVPTAIPLRYISPEPSPPDLEPTSTPEPDLRAPASAAGAAREAPGTAARARRAATVDLSGGGARVKGMGDLDVGTRLEVEIDLSSGPVVLDAEVLGDAPDGTVRLRFREVPEAVGQRIVRHVYQVQLSRRRRESGGGRGPRGE